jgi:hypothetical protein
MEAAVSVRWVFKPAHHDVADTAFIDKTWYFMPCSNNFCPGNALTSRGLTSKYWKQSPVFPSSPSLDSQTRPSGYAKLMYSTSAIPDGALSLSNRDELLRYLLSKISLPAPLTPSLACCI